MKGKLPDVPVAASTAAIRRPALAGLLGTLLLAQPAAGVVADYFCAPGAAPAAVCPSLQPPGGLSPSDTPQIVLLTFDDAVHSNHYALVQQVLPAHTNPNGQPIKATFFVHTIWSDYRWIQPLYAAGHEIALHTMNHQTGTNTDLATWRAEIAGCRKTISALAGIPAGAIRGFRAPQLVYTYDMLRILVELGLSYDASVVEWVGANWLSETQAAMVWPYTLDSGVASPASTLPAPLPRQTFPGLFEIPAWTWCTTNGTPYGQQDPPGDRDAALATLQYNFLAHYTGNRAPLGIFLHAGMWLTNSAHVAALNDFIAWTQASFTNVWYLTCADLVDYMRAPCSSAAAFTNASFQTVTHPLLPPDAWRTCAYYGQDRFEACTTCPPAYPAPDTVYAELVPIAGGDCRLRVDSVTDRTVDGTLLVSNTSARAIAAWQVQFRMQGGTFAAVYNSTTMALDGDQVRLSRSGWLAPGASTAVSILAKSNSSAFAFAEPTLQLFALDPRRPRLLGLRATPEQLQFWWDDSAFGYRVETTDTPGALEWDGLTELRYQTNWVTPIPTNTLRLYRLKTLP